MIEIININKTYNIKKDNACVALNKVCLTIKSGDMMAVIGKSGAGKSTLLHILGGLESFESGSYLFEGEMVEKMNDKKLSKLRSTQIGFVLQDFGLLVEENVINNVSIPLFFDQTSLGKIKEKAMKALEAVGISDLYKKKVKELSGGQKQRVAIARAIVNSPSLILADEPTGALDTATSEEIMDVFLNLNKQGKTIIIVTHEAQIAEKCKSIITINDGVIVGR